MFCPAIGHCPGVIAPGRALAAAAPVASIVATAAITAAARPRPTRNTQRLVISQPFPDWDLYICLTKHISSSCCVKQPSVRLGSPLGQKRSRPPNRPGRGSPSRPELPAAGASGLQSVAGVAVLGHRSPEGHQYCSAKQVSLVHEAATVPCCPAGRR